MTNNTPSLDQINIKEMLVEFEHKIETIVKERPSLALGIAFGSGVLIGYVGLIRIARAGFWLRANQGLLLSSGLMNKHNSK
jgi:hypothetical protein